MPDYSLGRAHGKIEITYDGSGADKAARDLDRVSKTSESADKSLTKTQRTVGETRSEMRAAGDSAAGYSQRLKDVENASRDVTIAENNHRNALLDTRATLDDIKAAEDEVTEAKKRHTAATDAARAAHRAFNGEAGGLGRTVAAMTGALSKAVGNITGLGDASSNSSKHVGSLTESVSGLAGGARGAAFGIEAVVAAAGGLAGVAQQLAGFEVAFAKISGATLGLTSLGGLAGMGGAAGLQGIVNVAGAAKQLSGVLGLLPATIAGVGFATQTLELAFRGVGDALTSMMDDDPTAFLEGLKDMAPVAAQSMLAIAQFRDGFKAAGAMVQESFFLQIADQIRPLIEMWLPAVAQGMSQVSAIFGQGASMLAQLLQQPAAMAAFQAFITNISTGLQAMLPAVQPVVEMFAQMVVVGSSFFGQIGDSITQVATAINTMVQEASASGEMQSWIQAGINGFGHLVNIVSSFGKAFLDIMTVADQFGGGGLLGWLDELTATFANWTSSAEGRDALIGFFSTMRTATDAFTPLLGPLVDGLISIGSAFVQLGTATAPGFQVLLDAFAQTMAQLGPQLAATAPAINTFLVGLAAAFSQLMAQVGPQLPQIFQMLADGFVALLPQLPPLTALFLELATIVGPQLAEMFKAVTPLLYELMPYFAILTTTISANIDVIKWLVEAVTGAVDGFTNFLAALGDFGSGVNEILGRQLPKAIQDGFRPLADLALNAGKSIVGGLIDGMLNAAGLSGLKNAAKTIVDEISSWFPRSPAQQGPFSGSGYTYLRGQKIVTDMAAGMTAARPVIESAASSTAAAASRGLAGAGGAPAPGGRETTGAALLPNNIASADTSVLTEYLRHQFSDVRGLKGLARDFGQMVDVIQTGADFLSQDVMAPVFQALGMLPGANEKGWRKMSPSDLAARQQQESERKSLEESGKQTPSWSDVLGPGASSETPALDGSVPLVQKPDGTWTSPNPAWAHLIERESSGVNQVQSPSTVDVNTGGNEAEGIFQITPKTWAAHGGADFAANPLAASVQQQAAVAARILRGNPTGSDWGAGLPGRESAEELMAGLTGAPPAGAPPPSWADVLGSTTVPAAGAQPSGTYGLPTGTDTGGYGTGNADTFPPWVIALAERFGVKASTYSDHQESDRGEAGYAPNPNNLNRGIDWSAPMNAEGIASMQRLAEYLQSIAPNTPGLEQIIWENPTTGQRVGMGGAGNLDPSYYPDSTYLDHQNHVHTRQSTPLPLPGGVGNSVTGVVPASLLPKQGVGSSAAAGLNSGLILPSGKSLDELTETSAKSLTVNEQLLQSYLQGNPALAGQLAAAQAPGAADETVLGALSGLSTTITDLTAQDAVGNKNTIDALRSQQNQLAQQTGFEQQPNAMQQAQSIAGGAAGAITGVFKSISSGLDALGATQDIADRLVYGVRNTEDVNKIIDNVQKYITFAADIVSTVGSILSTAGSFTGGSDMGGTSAAGSMLSLISGVMQGVNAAIDFGQQVYQITMSYVGKFISSLTAGLGGGFDMMGNVGFMLNTKTGQLVSYSQDNPEKQNQMNVPSFLQGLYGYGKYNDQNSNQPVQQQLNIFAGPGQSPAQVANETMWLVNTQGTTGALAPAAF